MIDFFLILWLFLPKNNFLSKQVVITFSAWDGTYGTSHTSQVFSTLLHPVHSIFQIPPSQLCSQAPDTAALLSKWLGFRCVPQYSMPCFVTDLSTFYSI